MSQSSLLPAQRSAEQSEPLSPPQHQPPATSPRQAAGSRTLETWQLRPAAHAGPWNGPSGSACPRCSPTCTSSPWPTRTGARGGTRSPPCSSSSSGTTRSAAASRCSPGCTTVSCSCAAFASRTKVRTSEHLHYYYYTAQTAH